MKNNKLRFLGVSSKSGSEKTPEQQHIDTLRAQARTLRDQGNPLVEKLWDINFKLENAPSASKKVKLETQKKELEQKLTQMGYPEQFHAMVEEIRQLELKYQGHTDLNNSVFDL